MPNTVVIDADISESLNAGLTCLADSLGRSKSSIVEQTLGEFIRRETAIAEGICQAVAEADAGDFATPEEVAEAFRVE